jgi:uncharacterized protein
LRHNTSQMSLKRYLYLGLGWLCIGLAFLGIILPIFPTVPFLLLAVWLFSRSSPELAARFRNHPRFGPMISAWQDHGVIPTYAKVLAVLMMAVMAFYLHAYSNAPQLVVYGAWGVMAAVAAYILSRPGRPPS